MTESTPFSQVQDLSAAFARLVGIAAPGIVAVQSDRAHSSGFFWRPGLIVTADEALSEEGDLTVTLPGGDSIAARLVGRDHTTDVALLRVDRSDLPPVRLESPPVPVGALAIAVGAEDGAPTAAFGVLSRSAGPWVASLHDSRKTLAEVRSLEPPPVQFTVDDVRLSFSARPKGIS